MCNIKRSKNGSLLCIFENDPSYLFKFLSFQVFIFLKFLFFEPKPTFCIRIFEQKSQHNFELISIRRNGGNQRGLCLPNEQLGSKAKETREAKCAGLKPPMPLLLAASKPFGLSCVRHFALHISVQRRSSFF